MAQLEQDVLFREAPVAYSILDLEGRQLAGNLKFLELFGYEASVERITATDLTHPDDREATRQYLRELGSGGREAVDIDKRYVRADGTVFWGHLTAHRITDADGTPLLIGMIEDIDERRKMEAQLRRAVEERSTFVAQVSHELRNPLHTIAGLAELLAASEIGGSERHQAEVILREARFLSALVDDLLDIGRAEAGHLVVDASPMALRPLADRVVRSRTVEATEKGLELTAVVDDAVPLQVLGDQRRVVQVLDNLIGNAIKFTDTGNVALRVDGDGRGAVTFTVSDTGAGIAQERVADIFEPFGRLDHRKAGAGLGLAISSRLATAMGGTLRFAPGTGGGSTFVLQLPLVECSGTEGERRPPPVRPDRRNKRVLVVEDSPEIQLLVKAQLERLGYPHDVVADGLTALEVSDEAGYSALLVDWHLPGIDGLEMIRRFRHRERLEGRTPTPVLALTARTMPGDLEACLEAGADGHIAKPASLHDLATALDTWTGATAESCGASTGVIDDDVLAALAHELGDVEVVASITHTFLEQLPARLASVVDAWPDDPVGVASAAHVVKGASAMVGATEMARVAAELEVAAAAGDTGGGDHLVRELRDLAPATTTELEKVMSRIGASR
jgi:PAS domain S-box-containing protein